MATLERIVTLLEKQDPCLAGMFDAAALQEREGPGAIAAAGPRVAGREGDYELVVEAVYEGYLLHYGQPRVVVRERSKPALRVLIGDHLYALGLSRLVEFGDVLAVRELADVLTIAPRAQTVGQPELAELAWEAAARAIGWGSSPAHRDAKGLALAGDPRALDALRACVA